MDWQTSAAIASALAAIVALGVAIYTVKRTLWISAVVALEQRFSQINHAKIINPNAWDSIRHDQELSATATHLVFETFQFYHQAFVLHKRKAMAPGEYKQWSSRLATDLREYHTYREWWLKDQKRFHSSWDADFVEYVNKLVAAHQNSANNAVNPSGGSGGF
jgi:hypothetical protein